MHISLEKAGTIKINDREKLISFRKSVLSLFMVASFFPAFLAGLPFVSRILSLEEKNAQTRLSFLAQSTANHIESTLEVLMSKVDSLAHESDLALTNKNRLSTTEFDKKFLDFLHSTPLPSAIYFFGKNARLTTTFPKNLKAQQHLPFLEEIKLAMNKTNVSLTKTFISWDEEFANEHWAILGGNKNNSSLAFIFKIKYIPDNHGEISGAIVVAIPSQRLSSLVLETIGPRSRARLYATNGPLVSVPYHAEDLKEYDPNKKTGNKVEEEISNSTNFTIAKSSNPIALMLTIWEPESQYKAPILESASWIAGLLMIIVIFFGYVGYLVALWLLRPMEALSTKVKEYSQGQYHTHQPKVDFVEFDDFLNLLESMAQKIEEQIEEVAESRKRETYLEKERIQSELSALRLQMNPHFLFNALNNVAAMISIDKNAAKEMLEKLSTLYHKILKASQQITIPLSAEVSLVRDYIYLQQSRFGDRLQYQEHLPEQLDHISIPGMLLQTLVENAVKHGIEKARRGGLIELVIEEKPDDLHIRVINTGQTYVPNVQSKGIGLINTKKRLHSIYGDRFSFNLSSDNNQRTVASIWIGKRGIK